MAAVGMMRDIHPPAVGPERVLDPPAQSGVQLLSKMRRFMEQVIQTSEQTGDPLIGGMFGHVWAVMQSVLPDCCRGVPI
jgi:hypothetical protein